MTRIPLGVYRWVCTIGCIPLGVYRWACTVGRIPLGVYRLMYTVWCIPLGVYRGRYTVARYRHPHIYDIQFGVYHTHYPMVLFIVTKFRQVKGISKWHISQITQVYTHMHWCLNGKCYQRSGRKLVITRSSRYSYIVLI